MAFNGTGVFQRIYSWAQDAANGINITDSRMDTEFDGIATALSSCLLKDGTQTVTANIPMSNFKFTGLGAGTARTDSANVGQVQDGNLNWVDGRGTADAITASYSPALTALVDGQLCFVRATAANATTTPTFSPNSLTARTIVKNGGVSLSAGDIVGDGHQLVLRYDLSNTRWELLNPGGGNVSGPASSISGNIATFSGTDGKTLADSGVAPSALLRASNNLSDLASASTARTNLGVYSTAEIDAKPTLKNRLINGDFAINQRAAASNADDTYALDCWNILTQTGAVAVTQLTDVENGVPYMMRITQSQASAQLFGAEQILTAMGSKPYRGSAMTLSARVRCSASMTLRYAVLEWTGTADTVTSDVISDWTSGTYTAGNFFLGANLTVTATGSTALTANTLTNITALTGTLGSSVNNLIVLFWTDSPQAQNVTLDIGKAQLEPGSTATAFEVRDQNDTRHLLFCERIDGSAGNLIVVAAPNAVTSGLSGQWITWRARKRITPVVTLISTSYNAGSGGGVFNISKDGAQFAYTVSGAGSYMLTGYLIDAGL